MVTDESPEQSYFIYPDLLFIGVSIAGIPFMAATLFLLGTILPKGVIAQVLMTTGIALGPWSFLLAFWELLGGTLGYLVTCSGLILCTLYLLLKNHLLYKQKLWLLLIFLSTLLFMCAPYRTAIQAADNYHLLVATEPAFLLRGLKNAQALGEVIPCRYTLLGWQQQKLFYGANCNDEVTTWQFDPDKTGKPLKYAGTLPPNLHTQIGSSAQIMNWVSVKDSYPPNVEAAVRGLHLQDAAIFSQNGKWVAVIARHLFAAEDVILLAPKR